MNKKQVGIFNVICAVLSIAAFFLLFIGELKAAEAYRDSLGKLTQEQSSHYTGLILGMVIWGIVMAIPLGAAAVLGFISAGGLIGKPKKAKDITFGIIGIVAKAITAAVLIFWTIIFFEVYPLGIVLKVIEWLLAAALIVFIVLDIIQLKKAN